MAQITLHCLDVVPGADRGNRVGVSNSWNSIFNFNCTIS